MVLTLVFFPREKKKRVNVNIHILWFIEVVTIGWMSNMKLEWRTDFTMSYVVGLWNFSQNHALQNMIDLDFELK